MLILPITPLAIHTPRSILVEEIIFEMLVQEGLANRVLKKWCLQTKTDSSTSFADRPNSTPVQSVPFTNSAFKACLQSYKS